MKKKIDAINEKLSADVPLSLDELKYYRSYLRREITNLKRSLAFLDEADAAGSKFHIEVASTREQVELGIERLSGIERGATQNIELLERT